MHARFWSLIVPCLVGSVLGGARADAAEPLDVQPPPRAVALCAALLTEPSFVRLGHKRTPSEGPKFAVVAGVMLPRAVTDDLEVRQWSREIVGAEDIAEYLGKSLALGEELDLEFKPDARFWTRDRKTDFAFAAVLPTLTVGATLVEALWLALHPEKIPFWGSVMASAAGLATWVARSHFQATFRYLGALGSPAWRARVEFADSDRADATTAFLRQTLGDVPGGRAVDEQGPALGVLVGPALAQLLVDVPPADAHPQLLANHRELIAREIVKPASAADRKLLIVHVDVEVTGLGVPKVVITGNLAELPAEADEGGPPGPPRRDRRRAEEIGFGAGQPALVPIPVSR